MNFKQFTRNKNNRFEALKRPGKKKIFSKKSLFDMLAVLLVLQLALPSFFFFLLAGPEAQAALLMRHTTTSDFNAGVASGTTVANDSVALAIEPVTSSIVTSAGVADTGPSIKSLDVNNLFICYGYYTGYGTAALNFAKSTNGGTSWTTATAVSTFSDFVKYTSIDAVDANNIFVSYYDESNGDLEFAKSTNGGTSWTASTIVSAGTVGYTTSIDAVDANNIFIVYYDLTNTSLKYAKSTNGGTSWIASAIDSSVGYGSGASIVALSASNLFVSYLDGTNNDLKFAKSTNGGTNWTTSTVDSTGVVGAYSSIDAVDANNLFISYYDSDNTNLKFAKSTNGGTNWATSIADSSSANGDGIGTSIKAIDANNIFISYEGNFNLACCDSYCYSYCPSGGDLKFAKSTNGGTSWASAVQEDSNGYFSTSIDAVDANNIFVSYNVHPDLKFLKNPRAPMQYYSSGTFTGVMNAQRTGVSWDTLSWQTTELTNTAITFKARSYSATQSNPDFSSCTLLGTANSASPNGAVSLVGNNCVPSSTPANQYLYYQGSFSTPSPYTTTPSLDQVDVSYGFPDIRIGGFIQYLGNIIFK
jgi:hypothetical protein